MASYLKPYVNTLKAGEALSAKAFHFVKFGADADHVIACSSAGEKSVGVVMNAPAAAEDMAEIAYLGGAKVKLAGTVAVGGEIACNAAGAGVAAAAGDYVRAIAMEAGVSGDVIGVMLANYVLES